jgi:hypothetical protein
LEKHRQKKIKSVLPSTPNNNSNNEPDSKKMVLSGETENSKNEFGYGAKKENDSEFADFVKASEDQFKKDNKD